MEKGYVSIRQAQPSIERVMPSSNVNKDYSSTAIWAREKNSNRSLKTFYHLLNFVTFRQLQRKNLGG